MKREKPGTDAKDGKQENGTRQPGEPKILWRHGLRMAWHLQVKKDDTNCYRQIDASQFPLRGKKYLVDKKKFPSKKSAFDLVCCKCFLTKEKMTHPTKEINSLRSFLLEHSDREFFVVNWLVPGHYTVVNLYMRTLPRGEDKPFDKLYEKFVQGDEKFRNERFKFIPQLLDAPYTVRLAVNSMLGGMRPVLIAKKLTCFHTTGKNFIEISIDTGSSRIVSAAASMMVRSFSSMTANIAFLIEGRDESELPERMLSAYTSTKVNVEQIAIKYDPSRVSSDMTMLRIHKKEEAKKAKLEMLKADKTSSTPVLSEENIVLSRAQTHDQLGQL